MSKTKKSYKAVDRDYYDGPDFKLSQVRDDRKDKRKKRRIDHALKTKNIDELLDNSEEY